jgi:sulfate/thiosulfate transport system ATP-binding protein
MAIEVRDVNKSFGPTPVLRDVSVDIASGSLTALLGPSGGGKSTLLRIIAGLETPDSGSVLISGVDATRLSPQRRNVGFVFQHYAAFKHLSVFRNVAFGLEIRKRPKPEIRKRVTELLELVHLEQFANRYPAQLSGGQRQRMALARALAVEPEVLLMDEPCSALDPVATLKIEELIGELKKRVTIVIVTHNMQQAARVADTTVFMLNGDLVEVGPTDKLFTNPDDERTEQYVTGKFG